MARIVAAVSLVPVPATTRTRARDERSLGDLDGRRDQALALGLAQGGGLAGRAARDEPVDAGQDLPADETPEGGLVEGAVRGERGDQGGEGAAQHRSGRARGLGRVGRAGHREDSFQVSIGRWRQAAMGSRANSSSTMGSKGWRPARRRACEPVGGGEDPGGIGGAVAGGQSQLDGLARSVEADEVHAGRRTGPDRDDLQVVRRAQAGVAIDDPPGQVTRGAGRAVELGAAVPLDEVRIEVVEAPEERDRRVDEPAEQRHAEAEVRGRDGRGTVTRQQAFDERPVGGPSRSWR